ncbi:MAG: hypothetical protein LVR00_04185 [Rhabdochlamydiaceae bacterium]
MKERSDMRIRVSSDPPEKPGPLQKKHCTECAARLQWRFYHLSDPSSLSFDQPEKSRPPLSQKRVEEKSRYLRRIPHEFWN